MYKIFLEDLPLLRREGHFCTLPVVRTEGTAAGFLSMRQDPDAVVG